MITSAAFQVSFELLLHIEHLTDVLHGQGFALVDGKGLCRSDRVLDLPTIEFVPRQGVQVILGKGFHVHLCESTNPLDENLEDCLLGSRVEVIVAKGNMDP